MEEEKWIWVTWKDNGTSVYNGKTHKVGCDAIVEPKRVWDLQPGDEVVVYWPFGKREYWSGIVAEDNKPTVKKRSTPPIADTDSEEFWNNVEEDSKPTTKKRKTTPTAGTGWKPKRKSRSIRKPLQWTPAGRTTSKFLVETRAVLIMASCRILRQRHANFRPWCSGNEIR